MDGIVTVSLHFTGHEKTYLRQNIKQGYVNGNSRVCTFMCSILSLSQLNNASKINRSDHWLDQRHCTIRHGSIRAGIGRTASCMLDVYTLAFDIICLIEHGLPYHLICFNLSCKVPIATCLHIMTRESYKNPTSHSRLITCGHNSLCNRLLQMLQMDWVIQWYTGRHFAEHIFICIFVNGKFFILIKVSVKFVLIDKGPIDNNTALASRQIGEIHYLNQCWPDSLTHICDTWRVGGGGGSWINRYAWEVKCWSTFGWGEIPHCARRFLTRWRLLFVIDQ